MKRKIWKRIFVASLVLLVMLMVFTILLWGMANAAGVLLRLLFILDEDMEVHGIPFAEFMSNFVGSPLFYVYVADLVVLAAGTIGLAATKKERSL